MLIQSFSGVRGIYNKDINEDIAQRYAYAFRQFLSNKNPTIVIGHDPRASSEAIKNAIVDVFDDIIDVGVAPIPAVELAVRDYKADAGIMITASHNPPEWNGFKFLGDDGAILSPESMGKVIKNFQAIQDISKEEFLDNFLYRGAKKHPKKMAMHKIRNMRGDIEGKYMGFILRIIGKENIRIIKKSNFKVVFDPNGGAGLIGSQILKKLGVRVITVNSEYGKFERKIEPTKESLSYLKRIIRKEKAVFGAGLDCDADRIEIVLPDGKMVSGQYVLALLVDEALSSLKSPENETVVTNDATSGVVREIAGKYKAKIMETEVGEANVVNGMLLHNSPVGGEGSSSGGIFPPNRCRDGILALAMVLRLMAKRKKPLEKIIEGYPSYYTERSNIEFPAEKHDAIKDKLREFYLKKGLRLQETGGISGGLKVVVDAKSFVWFRASKTEGAVFRVMADSTAKKKSEKLLKEAITQLRKSFK